MEDKIKNFDRSIEQAMNETTVTPPFGMWNRISAELEVPAPAPTSWVASSLIPKAALMGLVTVAVLETSLLVAYVFNNSNSKNITTENITPAQQPVQARNIISIPEVKPVQIAALPEMQAAVTLSRKVKTAPVSIAKPVDKNAVGVNQSNSELTNIAANSDVAVPQQQAKAEGGIGVATETYYFPPVDINKPEPKMTENNDATLTAVKPDDDEAAADKKAKLAPEKKSHFHPAKHHHQHLDFLGHKNK